MPPTRLRQVALVARALEPTARLLADELGLDDPYADPGIIDFGLENAVFAVGDGFVEIVSPVREGTTAGRYLDRRGGDGGYMAIFQMEDLAAARRRLADLGVRVVWQADHDDISGSHLHPRDVPGAIVSLDSARPPESWRWAGPRWTGGAPPHPPGGLVSLTVAADDPTATARRWAEVLGLAVQDGTDSHQVIPLDGGRQRLEFVATGGGAMDGADGITAVGLAVPSEVLRGREDVTVGGVRFALSDAR